jgi:hypothetical protein
MYTIDISKDRDVLRRFHDDPRLSRVRAFLRHRHARRRGATVFGRPPSEVLALTHNQLGSFWQRLGHSWPVDAAHDFFLVVPRPAVRVLVGRPGRHSILKYAATFSAMSRRSVCSPRTNFMSDWRVTPVAASRALNDIPLWTMARMSSSLMVDTV